jgi:hypothetical protein
MVFVTLPQVHTLNINYEDLANSQHFQ